MRFKQRHRFCWNLYSFCSKKDASQKKKTLSNSVLCLNRLSPVIQKKSENLATLWRRDFLLRDVLEFGYFGITCFWHHILKTLGFRCQNFKAKKLSTWLFLNRPKVTLMDAIESRNHTHTFFEVSLVIWDSVTKAC